MGSLGLDMGLDLREKMRVRDVHLGVHLWTVTKAVMGAMEEIV